MLHRRAGRPATHPAGQAPAWDSGYMDLRGLPLFLSRVRGPWPATPFSGSAYARFAPIRSLRSFSPRDAGLLQLAANLEINQRIASVHSTIDPHIPGGSHVDGARNIRLGTMGHFRIPGDGRFLDAVEGLLRRQA